MQKSFLLQTYYSVQRNDFGQKQGRTICDYEKTTEKAQQLKKTSYFHLTRLLISYNPFVLLSFYIKMSLKRSRTEFESGDFTAGGIDTLSAENIGSDRPLKRQRLSAGNGGKKRKHGQQVTLDELQRSALYKLAKNHWMLKNDDNTDDEEMKTNTEETTTGQEREREEEEEDEEDEEEAAVEEVQRKKKPNDAQSLIHYIYINYIAKATENRSPQL
ncbi:zinc finger protein CCCH domain-containing protein, partial [Reticulomyxa filosa]